MIECHLRNLSFNKKLLLSVASRMTVGVLVLFNLISPTPSHAQSKAGNTGVIALAFEVASIKPNKSSSGVPIIRPNGDGIHATYVTLLDLIRDAYGTTRSENNSIPPGAPSWADSDRFDIEAKVDEATTNNLSKIGLNQRELALDLMLQALLANRFNLVIHKEIREGPVYALTIAKRGPKMKPGTPIDPSFAGITTGTIRMTGSTLIAQDVSIERLVSLLTLRTDRPVIDRTELKGRYDFTLERTPDQAATPMFAASGENQREGTSLPEITGLPLFIAVQQQLGLKLEPTKGPVEILIIDHVERPSAN
jgi:bla regulator protein BlaR1